MNRRARSPIGCFCAFASSLRCDGWVRPVVSLTSNVDQMFESHRLRHENPACIFLGLLEHCRRRALCILSDLPQRVSRRTQATAKLTEAIDVKRRQKSELVPHLHIPRFFSLLDANFTQSISLASARFSPSRYAPPPPQTPSPPGSPPKNPGSGTDSGGATFSATAAHAGTTRAIQRSSASVQQEAGAKSRVAQRRELPAQWLHSIARIWILCACLVCRYGKAAVVEACI